MAGALKGVRVLDLTSVVMGPMATQILGDLGADVFTVESARGETNRVMGPGPHTALSGTSLSSLRPGDRVYMRCADGTLIVPGQSRPRVPQDSPLRQRYRVRLRIRRCALSRAAAPSIRSWART
jgi:hypothetical protein